MNNLEKAKALLKTEGFTCVLCRENTVYTSREKGISPMLDFIESKTDLSGFSAADKIVGKAAAMLFALAGIAELYAEVLSERAVPVLEQYGISFSYGALTDKIINRKGDGICPMEETVSGIDNINDAFVAVKNKRDELRKGLVK